MIARRLETHGLQLGGGLEVLLSATLGGMAAGDVVEVVTSSRGTALEIHGWARHAGHRTVGERLPPGGPYAVLVRRDGAIHDVGRSRVRGGQLLRDGEFHTADLRRGDEAPAILSAARGFAPLQALVERHAPAYGWTLNDRELMWADDVGQLAEQASAAQWDASRDVPWEAAADVPEHLERAVAQVMTFIAQNEYAAMYIPAGFLPAVNPGYPEILLWLASHIHDEARHVEVFTKRALIGGYSCPALASTELSLRTLLEERDFSGAALLLNVLGEGTFLDLLSFIAHCAPDAATHAAARLAHRDEVRHVHFGISHIRRRLTAAPEQVSVLVGAAETRAAKLTEMSGLSPLLTESLTIMAAGSLQPAELARGADAVNELLVTMERNRIRRLQAAGFSESIARHLSDLHTPNLM